MREWRGIYETGETSKAGGGAVAVWLCGCTGQVRMPDLFTVGGCAPFRWADML